MDGGVWQATVQGVIKSQTRLSNFTFTFFHDSFQNFKKKKKAGSVFSLRKKTTGRTHKSTQALPELDMHGGCVPTAMLEPVSGLDPGTRPGEEKRLRMVSGATYWTKWVSVSPEPSHQ